MIRVDGGDDVGGARGSELDENGSLEQQFDAILDLQQHRQAAQGGAGGAGVGHGERQADLFLHAGTVAKQPQRLLEGAPRRDGLVRGMLGGERFGTGRNGRKSMSRRRRRGRR